MSFTFTEIISRLLTHSESTTPEFKEAVVNMLVHRNFTGQLPARIIIYRDRVEKVGSGLINIEHYYPSFAPDGNFKIVEDNYTISEQPAAEVSFN